MLRTLSPAVVALFAASAFSQTACEVQRVVGPPEIRTYDFGWQVRTNGQQWLVADDFASTLCGGPPIECGTGAVFSYEFLEGQLVHRQTILPPNTRLYDSVGGSIDADGDRLIVGVPGRTWPGSSVRTGAAFVYDFDGEQWVESARIPPPPEAEGGFGAGVLLDGPTAIIKRANDDRLYRFELVADQWEFRQTISPPDLIALSCFGCSAVSANGWYFFGAFIDASLSRDGGSVYVYRQDTEGTLEFVQKIIPSDVGYFSAGLDFDGRTLVVGAPYTSRDHDKQGVVHTYRLSDDRWELDQEIVRSSPTELGHFGWATRLAGDRLLATTHREYDPWIVRGMTHVFERAPDGTWTEGERLEPSPPRWAGQYGSTIATDGRHALIGAFDDQSATGRVVGAAYLFDLECTDCPVDLDADGSLTVFDFLTFLNLFQDGDPIADFDGDGALTILDFLAFQTAFEAGCW